MNDHSHTNKAEFLEVSKRLDDLLTKQEIYWHQQSKVSWLKHGDKNAKFFHSKASQQRRSNFIKGIRDQHQNWVEGIDDIARVATNHFESIFSSSGCDQMDECLNTVPHKVTLDILEVLSSEYSVEEVKTALFHMGPTKAPRHDGMNALFYQKFWHIVGDDVTAAVLDFLNSSNMLFEINYTHIVLIPKIKSLERISDYRPISLCNVIYKIISKVLANRLKLIFLMVISPTQIAFVPGHLITDNVLVVYETLHTIHGRRSGRRGSLALKLDINKTYDHVEWPFLMGIMSRLGLPESWIDRVMTCVTSPTFFVCINGKAYGTV